MNIPAVPCNTSNRQVHPASKVITKEQIDLTLSEYFNVVIPDEVCVKSRRREICYIRQICMFMYSKYTRMSLKSIGEIFAGRDHTTVIHSNQTIKDLMDSDEMVLLQVRDITKKLFAMASILKIDSQEVLASHYLELYDLATNVRFQQKAYDKNLSPLQRELLKAAEGKLDRYFDDISTKPVIQISKL